MTTSLWLEAKASLANPLDLAEEVISNRDWAYDRTEHQELVADVSGTWCNYHVNMNWHEPFGALTFSCAMDTKLPKNMVEKLYPLLAKANEKLWLGHFDAGPEQGAIVFRYSMLLKGGVSVSLEQVEDLLDVAITECERFFPAFQSVLWGGKTADDALEMAMLETVGEA